MRRLALVLAATFVGCAQIDTGSQALRALAESLDCPEARVAMTQVGAYRYRGEGCGRDTTVVCTASRLEPTCLHEATAGGAVARAEQGDPAEEPATDASERPPTVAATPDATVEAQIRAGLDARREDVLACVGRDRVGVRAGYAPDGSVAFSLQGDLTGSPEEACVADALDGVRVPANGEAGVVIHLVR